MKHAAILAVALAGGCHHYHLDTNAPGRTQVEIPPADLASGDLEYPDDPGEELYTLSTGVLGGGGVRARDAAGIGDFAIEATFNHGYNEHSHNDRDHARLFIPSGAIFPLNGWGVSLGWSALQIVGTDRDTSAKLGPVYVEVQRFRVPWAVGAGWAVQPTTGDQGPQLNLLAGVVFLRTRYLFDGGLEFHLGYQLKFPTTWVRSR